MNFGELYSKVIEQLGERSTPQQWSEAELKDYINRGQREFFRQTRYKTLLSPLVPAENGRYWPLPKMLDCRGVYFNRRPLERRSVEYLESDASGTSHFRGLHGDGKQFGTDFRSQTADRPDAWYWEDGRICLWPVPNSTTMPSPVRIKQTGTLAAGATSITLSSAITTDKAYVDLFIDGAYQNQDQFLVPNSNTINGISPLGVSVEYEVVAYTAQAVASTRTVKERYVMAAGTARIQVSRGYVVGVNSVTVVLDSITQSPSSFTELDAYTLVLASPLLVTTTVDLTIIVSESGSSVEARYVPMPGVMVETTDSPDVVQEDLHDALWQWACWVALSREGRGKDIQRAQKYLMEFGAMVKDFNAQINKPMLLASPEMPFMV